MLLDTIKLENVAIFAEILTILSYFIVPSLWIHLLYVWISIHSLKPIIDVNVHTHL